MERRAGDVAAPVGVVRYAAGADDGDVVVAPFATAVGFEIVADAGELVDGLAAVLADVVVPDVVLAVAPAAGLAAVPDAVAPVDVDVDVDVAAGADAGSMMHKARGECWVLQVSKVSTVAEVVAAAVAGGEGEIECFGTTSCVSAKIAGADSVRDFFAKPGRVDVKTAGES